MSFVKGTDLNLSGADQIRIALRAIHRKGGTAFISDIYEEMEKEIYPHKLSRQGKASLRFFVNKIAVAEGLIQKYDPSNKGWRMTKKSERLFHSKMKTFIKTSIIPNINLSGRGGAEGKLSDIFCESRGWKRVNGKLYDFIHETGLKVELKKQQDVQWVDPSKYHNLTEEEKQILIVFILHKSGKIDKMFSMKVCTFLDKVGWSEQFCEDAADFVSNYKNSALQIKAKVKVRNLFANNTDLVEVLYDA